MVPKYPAARARINRNGSDSSGSEISCDTGHRAGRDRYRETEKNNVFCSLMFSFLVVVYLKTAFIPFCAA